ncbi:MAG: hypothetical protein Q9168_002858 [Polycauliona sp. 1 TL-2023]
MNSRQRDIYHTPPRNGTQPRPQEDRQPRRERAGIANAVHQQRQREKRLEKIRVQQQDHPGRSSRVGGRPRTSRPVLGDEGFWQPKKHPQRPLATPKSSTASASSEGHSQLEESPARNVTDKGSAGDSCCPAPKHGMTTTATEWCIIVGAEDQEKPITTRLSGPIEYARGLIDQRSDALKAAKTTPEKAKAKLNLDLAVTFHNNLRYKERQQLNPPKVAPSPPRTTGAVSSTGAADHVSKQSGSGAAGDESDNEESDGSATRKECKRIFFGRYGPASEDGED